MSNELTSELIESWISRHFDYRRRSRGKQLAINNPFDDDKSRHFYVNLERVKRKRAKEGEKPNFWVHDFRPGHQRWDGSFLNFVRQFKNISYFEAAKEVCGGNTNDAKALLRQLKAQIDKDEDYDDVQPEDMDLSLPLGSTPFSKKNNSKARELSINYLNSRSITEDQAVANFLHYTPTSIVFPYIEYGIMVYWQERAIITKEFRFPDEAETGLAKTDFLYGFDHVEPNDYVIIVEAIIDKISIGDNVVASGGADVVGMQLRKLKALNPQTVILAPDNDEAGLASLRLNHDALLSRFGLAYCIPPIAKHELKHGEKREFKDWNRYDQHYGSGWSKRYIEKHSRRLSISALVKPRVEQIDVQS